MYYLFTGSSDESLGMMMDLVGTFKDFGKMYRYTEKSDLKFYWWGKVVDGTMYVHTDNGWEDVDLHLSGSEIYFLEEVVNNDDR